MPLSSPPSLARVAATDPAGFALQNATPAILTWNVPNDGQPHRVTLFGLINVTAAETGGLVQVQYTGPQAGAQLHTSTIFAAGLALDTAGQTPAASLNVIVAPGSVVTLAQASALTAGAARVWAELWGL